MKRIESIALALMVPTVAAIPFLTIAYTIKARGRVMPGTGEVITAPSPGNLTNSAPPAPLIVPANVLMLHPDRWVEPLVIVETWPSSAIVYVPATNLEAVRSRPQFTQLRSWSNLPLPSALHWRHIRDEEPNSRCIEGALYVYCENGTNYPDRTMVMLGARWYEIGELPVSNVQHIERTPE